MTTAENSINTVATAVRGVAEKTADLMDATHLHSLGDAGHEAASRLLAGTPDLTARFGSGPVDLHSLRESTARRAHQLAHSIDDHADALAPTHPGGRRWLKRFLVLALFGGAAFYLTRKLTRERMQSQQVDDAPVGVQHENGTVDGWSTGATQGKPADAIAATPGFKNSSSRAGLKKADAK
jgi:hypothetical protein